MFSTEKEAGSDVLSVKNAQDRLDRLSSAFELFPSAVVLLDVGGAIEYANPVFLSLGGYSKANAVVGKKYSEFTDDAGAIRFAGEIIPALLSGNVWTGEFYQRKESGLLYASYMMCSPIEVKKGERKHLLLNFYDATEKRKSESALKISDELLNLVLKSRDIGTWELDISKNKWTFSKPFLDFLGYSTQEVSDDVTFWEGLIHKDDLPKVSGALMSHLQAKTQVFECEYRVLSKSGEWKWVISRGKVMGWSQGGKPSRVLGIYNSVHEARKNSESLKDIENKYRLITEIASEGIIIADDKSNATYVNQSMADMLGYHANEILGCSVLSYVSEKSVEQFKGHLERIKQGIREEQELELKTKDNKRISAVLETAPLIDDTGAYMGAISVISNITQIKSYESQINKIEETLADSEKKYEALAESVNDIAYAADANGIIREVSPAVTRILGFDAKDIVGIRLQGLIHPEDFSTYASSYNKALNGSPEPYEFRLIDKNGAIRHMRASGKTLIGMDGSKSVSGLLTDITQYKNAQDKLLQNEVMLKQSEEKYNLLSENAKELKKTERRYRQLIEVALEGIWIIDETSNTSFVNYRMAEMLGYSVNEMLGRHIYMFMDEKAIETCKQGIEKSRQGLTESQDFEYRRKNGGSVYARIQTSPITDEFGTYTGTLIAVSDKTRAKLAEEKLAASENNFLKLLENIEDLFLSFSARGTITYAGSAVGRILSYDAGDLVGKNLREYIHPDDLAFFAGVFDASLKGAVAPFDFRLLDKKGSIHHMRGVSQVYVTGDGSKTLSMLLADITDKKNAEELLRRSEERFKDVLETEEEYIWETDGQIYYTFVSDKSTDIKGYTPQELIGRNLLEHMPEDDMERFRKGIDEAVSQKKPFRMELRTINKKGETIWEEINGKPLYGLQGKFMGLRGAGLDITERKKAEDELQETERKAEDAIKDAERKSSESIKETEERTAELLKETERKSSELIKETEERTSESKKQTERIAAEKIKETEERTAELLKEAERKSLDLIEETENRTARILKETSDRIKETETRAEQIIKDTEQKTSEKIKETETRAEQIVKDTEQKTSEKIKETETRAEQIVKDTEQKTSEKIKETETRAEQIVKDTERKDADIIDFLPDATFVADMNGIVIAWNKEMEELTGIPSRDMLGKGTSEYASILCDRDKKPVRIDLCGRGKEEIEGFGYHSVEIRDNALYAKAFVESPNGHAAYIWIKASSLRDSQDRKTGWITTLRDITSKKKASDDLKELRIRQKALLDNIPEMAWVKDENLRYIAVNEAFEKACGKKEEEILGKTDKDIWPGELAEKYAQDDSLVIQSGRGGCFEDTLQDASSGRRLIETIKSPIFESGSIVGIAGISRDITDRRLIEGALKGPERDQTEKQAALPGINKTHDSVFRPFFRRK
jgi:PAS domain S-box-containing protein